MNHGLSPFSLYGQPCISIKYNTIYMYVHVHVVPGVLKTHSLAQCRSLSLLAGGSSVFQ